MNGWLSTHVLDTANGCPAGGMLIELFEIKTDARERLKSMVTNADGRIDEHVLDAAEMRTGVFELLFHAGAYFAAKGTSLPEPPFLDQIPIRFGIADAGTHYHVPLLVSPWAFSSYRGS